MSLGSQRVKHSPLKSEMEGFTSELAKSVKLLGLTIDQKWKYGTDTSNIFKEASAKFKSFKFN